MQNFQRIAATVTVAFSFTCFTVPVLGAQGLRNVPNAPSAAASGAKSDAKVLAPAAGAAAPGAVAPGGSVGDLLKGGALPGDTTVVPGIAAGTGEEPGGGATDGSAGSVGGGGTGESTLELPVKPDWMGSLASQVKSLREQFVKEHKDLLKAYQEMQKQAKEVGKEERDKVREQFKVQREEMLTRQKELREELKRRFQEFRAEHPEHMEIIDAAKERAKEAVRERRGHGSE
ncbi:MAG: hypothetical protein AB7O66_05415 [Limisphaerales bacterium]